MGRIVRCTKLKIDAEGLDTPPFSGPLGEEVFNNVSAQAWAEWRDDMMIKVVNEYRLNLTDRAQYDVLLTQMRAFLGLDDGASVLEVENAARGRS